MFFGATETDKPDGLGPGSGSDSGGMSSLVDKWTGVETSKKISEAQKEVKKRKEKRSKWLVWGGIGLAGILAGWLLWKM